MTDFSELNLSEKELSEYPLKRIQHFECTLRYFFGQTKLIHNGSYYKIQLLDKTHGYTKEILQTDFYENDITRISYAHYIYELMNCVFTLEKMAQDATKKSRP